MLSELFQHRHGLPRLALYRHGDHMTLPRLALYRHGDHMTLQQPTSTKTHCFSAVKVIIYMNSLLNILHTGSIVFTLAAYYSFSITKVTIQKTTAYRRTGNFHS